MLTVSVVGHRGSRTPPAASSHLPRGGRGTPGASRYGLRTARPGTPDPPTRPASGVGVDGAGRLARDETAWRGKAHPPRR